MAVLLSRHAMRLFARVVRPDIVNAAKTHIQPIRFPKVTYNDMTKPEGPWQEKYDALNAEYSKYMYLGMCLFVVSLGIKHAGGSGFLESETRGPGRYSGVTRGLG
ncbi:hypothetical protein TcWFU_008265 [Taenia crassiceps]|uniref:Deltamethrin resistance protein prag01 domain-containing protein n=1 Tax=Taenia crassiceps TaxID=6207 RepID=A0ABR4QSK9_9CEST